MNRVKKNKKKGFTLVELMIVVVIMVILAAAASPIFKGYLDRAKEAGYLANCRTIYVATQTVIQDYAIAGETVKEVEEVTADFAPATEKFKNFGNDVQRLAQLKITKDSYTMNIDVDNLTCTSIVYEAADGTEVTFTPDKSAIAVVPTTPAAGA